MAVKLKTGDLVNVVILKQLPHALLVKLPNGSYGIIRNRELSWYTTDDPITQQSVAHVNGPGESEQSTQYTIGSELHALVIGQRDHLIELSLRLVESDPWQNILQQYEVGQYVRGIVANVDSHGVFVELEPAVVGRLLRDNLPSWITKPIQELFWIGDQVYVQIQQIDAQERTIRLSMDKLSDVRWSLELELLKIKQSHPDKVYTNGTKPKEEHLEILGTASRIQALEHLGQNKPKTILVIEDNHDQLNAFRRWLENAGQHVMVAQCIAEAQDQIQHMIPDVILCDFGLPDGNGLSIAREIQSQYPDIRFLIMTDWATASQEDKLLAELTEESIELLIKPLEPINLLNVLLSTQDLNHSDQIADSMQNGLLRQLEQSDQQNSIEPDSILTIDDILTELRRETRTTKVILFSIDSRQRQVDIVEDSGPSTLNRRALNHLIHSPVRDVAEDKTVLHIADSSEHGAYLRYLNPLIKFKSCVGVPVQGQLDRAYALFLFHPATGFSGAAIERYAKAAAYQISARLEQDAFSKKAREMQRYALMGHLTRALVHETNHHLTPILFALDELKYQKDVIQEAFNANPETLKSEIDSANQMFEQLEQNVRNLLKVVRMFGQVTVQDRVGIVSVDKVVETTTMLLRDVADRAHIQIQMEDVVGLMLTRAREVQVQQIILNVLLNAIQQIEMIRPEIGGCIQISMANRRREGNFWIAVRIEDDGPGIHRHMWRQILDLGITTRGADGSGMGLYIANQLVNEIGGQIYVEESFICWGTRFTIEFPAAF
ncbi:response regulator [Chloroflexi bacterium TSY]|nr:response regulator [Chloroflexi bacterium TSY]